MNRASGIIMAVTSLPSKYGIGTLGKAAYDFTDFLSEAGQKYWQMLPLGPTSYGNSPYQSFSTFAGNPYLIDLDLLIEDGLLTKKEVETLDWGDDPRQVDYGKIYEHRFAVLEKAKERGYERDRNEIEKFKNENAWLDNYTLFMACKKHFDMKSWLDWPDENLRKRNPDTLNYYRNELKDDIEFYTYIQFLFFKQWEKLKEYIHSKDIEIIGDLPIYVALDSADVWGEPEQFLLDDQFVPKVVSGVPPDFFSKDGQLWGNPIYDWNRMKNEGYGWWIRRIEGCSKLFDMIRVDHFKGFEQYWSVPYGEETARNGQWIKGPGWEVINVLKNWFYNTKFIAEDLGVMTEGLKELLEKSEWPGMKVLEFAFDSSHDSDFLTHKYSYNCVCYSGTHDNQPIMEWAEDAPEEAAFAKKYFNISEEEGLNWGIIRGGMASVADTFIVPFQDYLGLGKEGRMNTPGEAYGCWSFRVSEKEITGKKAAALAEKIRDLSVLYGRAREPENKAHS